MLQLDAKQKAARKSGQWTPAWLAEIETSAGTVYAWLGSGPITVAGQEYAGVGLVAGIDAPERETEPTVEEVRLVLSNVPPDQIDLVSETTVKGLTATIKLAMLDKARVALGSPFTRYVIDLDRIEVKLDDDGTYTVAVTGFTGLWNLTRPTLRPWSPEEQKLNYSGDTGMDDIPKLVDREVSWTRT